MKTRVVVTGMGAITPIGNDVESFWQALKDKTLALAPLPILTRQILNASWRLR